MVSIIIPTYNREQTVMRAIKSILDQTYVNFELIIVDDGSTDHTENIISQIFDLRLRYIRQENAGACVARNRGIEAAQGEYIAFHDSDDVWHSDKLEKQMEIIDKSGADVVFCKYMRYEGGDPKGIGPQNFSNGFLKPPVNLFGIGTQTILGKRIVFDTFKFDATLPRFQEMELLMRIMDKYSIYCLDELLVDYYLGLDSISNNNEKLYKACELILKKHTDINKKFPRIVNTMSSILISSANNLCKINDNNYYKYLMKSYQINHTLKSFFRIFLAKIGLYKLIIKLKS